MAADAHPAPDAPSWPRFRRRDRPFNVAGIAMTLRQLSYLVRVIETGSMTRAAEQLRVAQPALGTQIRLLGARPAIRERKLGTHY